MGIFDNYECEGQIEMTDYLKSKIKCGRVKDLTAWINSQGKEIKMNSNRNSNHLSSLLKYILKKNQKMELLFKKTNIF